MSDDEQLRDFVRRGQRAQAALDALGAGRRLTPEQDGRVLKVNRRTYPRQLPPTGDGWGFATFTRDLAAALRFSDFAAAYRFYGTRPPSRPTRPDGKPNRPLTAFTMQFVRVPDA